MNKLDRITSQFSRVYERNKKAKEALEKNQKKLFDAFTKELDSSRLAKRTVDYPTDTDLIDNINDIDLWVQKYFPGWIWTGTLKSGKVVIREDPSLLKFTYVNHETGMVYGRDKVEGTPSLDDEQLKADDPELWERITEWPEPWWSLVRDVYQEFYPEPELKWTEKALDAQAELFLQKRGVQRVIKDLNKVSDEDLSRLQEYMIPGPVSVRLRPPRQAKPEELEDNE